MQFQSKRKPDTNLGELIAAAGELAFEYSNSDKEGYRLARLALIEFIKHGSIELQVVESLADASARKHDLN